MGGWGVVCLSSAGRIQSESKEKGDWLRRVTSPEEDEGWEESGRGLGISQLL